MRILVTGGLGFVGSHLVDHLAKDNDVVVIDNLSSESSSRDYIRSDVEYWIDDIANLNTYRYAVEKFDVIYHLAALARIQPSFKDPLKYLSIDMMGTAHVCELARSCNAKLVYAGSSSAYAGPMLNPYAFAKFTGEQCCEMYSKVYGLSTVSARFFNVYGIRQPTSGPYATVVGIFEKQISDGNNALRGLMLESHLIEGNQSISDNLTYGQSITDACMSWDDTLGCLHKVSEAVQMRRG